jgi:hypothetical protein
VWILKGRPAPENIYLIKILINYGIINRIGGVMVRMHATSAVDRVFEPRSGQTKDYIKLGTNETCIQLNSKQSHWISSETLRNVALIRICHLCRDGVGDEYHYLFLCKNEAVFELRQKYIPRYYHLNPNITKMGGMLSL